MSKFFSKGKKTFRKPSDKEIKKHLFHLHIDYSWDFPGDSTDAFIVFDRFIFSNKQYYDYYEKALEKLTEIYNMNYRERNKYLKSQKPLTVYWLMYTITVLDNISYYDIDLYDNFYDDIENVSQGIINRKKLLTSLSGNLLAVNNKIPYIERVSSCSEKRNDKNKLINKCLKYEVDLIPKPTLSRFLNPNAHLEETNTYCLEIDDLDNPESRNKNYPGYYPDKARKYINERMNKDISKSYKYYVPLLYDHPRVDVVKKCDQYYRWYE